MLNRVPGNKVQQTEYDPDQIILDAKVSIGVDPSFGSKFGIVATRFANERIEVIEAEEYARPDFNDMTNRIWELKQKHRVNHIQKNMCLINYSIIARTTLTLQDLEV